MDYRPLMHGIHRSKALRLGLLAGACWGAGTLLHGDESASSGSIPATNPYQIIIDTNPFRLKDPPPPAEEAKPTNAPPQMNVKFTGIYRVNGITKACLALVDPTVKPPNNPNRFYALAAGEWQDGVKVLDIDPAKETVRVESSQGIAVLNFKEHGFAAAGAPPPAPTPAGAKPPGAIPGARPGVAPTLPGTTVAAPAAALTAFQSGGATVPINENVIQTVDASTGLRTIPSRQIRTESGGTESGAVQALLQYATAEQRAAQIRASGRTPPPMPPLPGMPQAQGQP